MVQLEESSLRFMALLATSKKLLVHCMVAELLREFKVCFIFFTKFYKRYYYNFYSIIFCQADNLRVFTKYFSLRKRTFDVFRLTRDLISLWGGGTTLTPPHRQLRGTGVTYTHIFINKMFLLVLKIKKLHVACNTAILSVILYEFEK